MLGKSSAAYIYSTNLSPSHSCPLRPSHHHLQPASRSPVATMFANSKPSTRIILSYGIDWAGTIILAGILAIINDADGFRRQFSLTDTSIQHTYSLHERVPTWLLAVCSFVIPVLIVAAVGLGLRRSLWDFHSAFLGLVLTHALTLTITTLIKVTVGRPRPDLIDRCQPAAGAMNGSPYGLATQAVCTTPITDHIIRDGFRSFPSGHASTSFSGLTFLSLYLAGKVHLFDNRGHALGAWLVLFPLVGATLIAVSRTMDYRHHATDVIAGGLLGFWISVMVYGMYYPWLNHPQAHKPWAPRVDSPFSRGGGFDRFDSESAERPRLNAERNGFGPVPSHDEAGGVRNGGGFYSAGGTAARTYGHGRNSSATAGIVDGSAYSAAGGAIPRGAGAKVPPPVHATGPRTEAHGYQAPQYRDAATLARSGPGVIPSSAVEQGKEDVGYDAEFASRPYRGGGGGAGERNANDVELGGSSYTHA